MAPKALQNSDSDDSDTSDNEWDGTPMKLPAYLYTKNAKLYRKVPAAKLFFEKGTEAASRGKVSTYGVRHTQALVARTCNGTLAKPCERRTAWLATRCRLELPRLVCGEHHRC